MRAGVIYPGHPIDQIQVDFAHEIVTLCARVADRNSNPECVEDTIGDMSRGQLLVIT